MIIETKIIEKPAFTVVGITEKIHFDTTLPPSENAIAKLWSRFNNRIAEIPGTLGRRSFGLMLQSPDHPSGTSFEYTAAAQIVQEGDIPKGMKRIEVPSARYIVFTHRGHLDGISSAFQYFWGNWLPNSPYEYDGGIHTGKYEFEFYDQRYTQPADPISEIDLYFPIRAKPIDNGTPFKQIIGSCYVHVFDFEKAYDFYTNILGLRAAWKSNDNNKPLAGFNMENGTGFIIVGMPGKVTPLPYAAFHFQCKDVAEAHRYLKEKGVEVTHISDDGHGFEFWDPEGNKLHTMAI
jgi:predicted transcriptional regulator YdeE/predicted enzyme related to lactoylglutathione lyase